MADEVRKQRPGWAVHWVSSTTLGGEILKIGSTITNDSQVVCLFVKGYYSALGAACKQHLNAVVLHDTVDNLAYLRRAHDAKFLRAQHIDAMIVQTRKKMTEARANGAQAYYLPHHHTNFADIHRSFDHFTGPAKTLGILSASGVNNPSSSALQSIAHTTCAFGVELVMIQQAMSLPLRTTLTRFPCFSNGTIGHESASSVDENDDSSADDPYQQLPYHRHPIFQQIDIALLWPPTAQGGSHTEVRSAFQRQNEPSCHDIPANHMLFVCELCLAQLRPPTRMIFWMTHGVPVIFYPYVAYTEVTQQHKYYEKCLSDSHMLYEITNTTGKLAAALRHVLGESHATNLRCLSARGRQVADQYSSVATGVAYANLIESAFRA